MGEVYNLPLKDLKSHIEKIEAAVFNMYKKTVRMSRRELCFNGINSYYIEMILPHLRKAGMYDYVAKERNFWEIDQRISSAYYEIPKRNFVQVVVPQKIFSGAGYLPFSEKADLRDSKYVVL
jgi:hypothetical protein